MKQEVRAWRQAALAGWAVAGGLGVALGWALRDRRRLAGTLDAATRAPVEPESQARYRMFFQKNRVPCLIIDPVTARLLDANEAAARYYGYSVAALRRMHITQINTLSHAEVHEEMRRAREEEANHFVFKHRLADGRIRDVQVFSDRGTHLGHDVLFSVILDITDRLEAERAAEAERALLDGVMDSFPGLFYVYDARGRLVRWNAQHSLLTGYSDEELGRMTHHDWVREADHAEVDAILARVRAGETLTSELELLIRDGQTRPFLLTSRQVEIAGERYIVGAGLDLSARRRAEAFERLAVRVLDSTVEGIVIVDAHARVLRVNQAFVTITGISAEAITGRSLRRFETAHHTPAFYRALWQTLHEQGRWTGEVWITREDGALIPLWATISAVRDDASQPDRYVVVFSDISDLKRAQQRLEHLAMHDPLTALPNRRCFDASASAAIEAAGVGERVAVLFIDLDRFKDINDSFGHHIGDELLRLVADRLGAHLPEGALLARQGGDEFIVLIERLSSPDDAARAAEVLLDGMRPPFVLADHTVHISASIGISLYPDDGPLLGALVRGADAAMFRAKEQGRHRYAMYHSALTDQTYERLLLENMLREAMRRESMELYYQPQHALGTGALVGLEALLRWHTDDGQPISPARFIPIAEDCGLIDELGLWVLRRACAQAQTWREAGWPIPPIAVNIAASQLERDDFADQVEAALKDTQLPGDLLILELTERVIMRHPERALGVLHRLHTLGVKLAIDDFGTGYSSLSYLKRLPIHELKLDLSFVRDLPDDAESAAIARAVAALGQTLQLRLVAEGVETEPQRAMLHAQGFHHGQGYLYARALPPDAIAPLLAGMIHPEV